MFSVSTSKQLSTDPERANYCLAYFVLLLWFLMINKKFKRKKISKFYEFSLLVPFHYLSRLIILNSA